MTLGCIKCRTEQPPEAFPKSQLGRSRRWCRGCFRENTKKWRAANPERAKDGCRAWRKKNPGHRRAYVAANPDIILRADLKRYGLSLEAFRVMLAAQCGACAICRTTFSKRPCVDHDHATGAVRGLLCGPCNTILGFAKDNTELLLSAAGYVASARTMKKEA